MRVAGIQCDLVWEDPEANRRALLPRVEAAVRAGARLVVLPEMWPTGFSMAAERIAEPEGGPSERWMSDLARRTGAAVCGSVAQHGRSPQPEGRRPGADEAGPPGDLRVARSFGGTATQASAGGAGRPRNCFVLALPDGAVHRYAKTHPFTFGGEAAVYDPGDEAVTVTFDGVRITPFICYDLRFPEAWAALAPRTDLFVCVANWPVPRVANWTALLLARAIETQAYVLGVNRVGTGGGLSYSGGSRLISPLGAVMDAADPADANETVVAGDVDAGEVAALRARFPFLADRRPDVYRRWRGE